MQDLIEAFVELIRRAATQLPADMERALQQAESNENPDSAAKGALDTILRNVALARSNSTPICQDTGTPIFEIHYPVGTSTREIAGQIRQACAIATERAYLRPNAVAAPWDMKGGGVQTGYCHQMGRDGFVTR